MRWVGIHYIADKEAALANLQRLTGDLNSDVRASTAYALVRHFIILPTKRPLGRI